MTTATGYKCASCGRKLCRKRGKAHWVYSRFTGMRYCWPGEGCQKVTAQAP